MQNEERKQKALDVLSAMGLKNLDFLGQGEEGVVFCNADYVYKVYLSQFNGKGLTETYRSLSFFTYLRRCKHTYIVDEIINDDNCIIAKYKFEESQPCNQYTEEMIIPFLTECWQNKIILQDCKPHNFVIVDGNIKLIDFEGCDYTDNLFLNMCVRAYLYANFSPIEATKLQRSAINNFELPELAGVRNFVNRVFANIIYEESVTITKKYTITERCNSEVYNMSNLPNLEDLFFASLKDNKYLSNIEIDDVKLNSNLYFEPHNIQVSYKELQTLNDKVTLLIKTCAQDVLTIEENVKHIVKQLSTPNPFFEVVVSIDIKEKDFLREYNSNGNLQELLTIVKKLADRKIIDRYFLFDVTQTESINEKWFGERSNQTHTTKNTPISSQLYAFEQCKGDYILQADSDVLIGRKDYRHSFLTDMISELKRNEKVISVGFNIYNKESNSYFGFENGGFVPEVRLGLFDKNRLFKLRPYPNILDDDGKLQISWYRSVEQFQRQTGYCSIRGGDCRTFYVHPQNYRKTEPYAWMTILDRVEQCQMPDLQYGGFDCEGSYYDWCTPKRNEKMVVVSVFRNVPIERFLRFWCSLMSQTFQNFGVILYDDCSDNGLQYFIDKLIIPFKNKITFIKGRHKDERMANEYRCIHYYCGNPQSIIVMVDGDDALIGNKTLANVYKKYEIRKCDVTVGRVHQTYRLQPHYRYPVNLCNPRNANGGNVWQHLKTFKKYLFDSIPITHFKYNTVDKTKISRIKWLEQCDDYAFMIPIVEMSKNPIQMDFVNYFYERNDEHKNDDRDIKEKCIAEILQKQPLTSDAIFIDRKSFMPDFERIEIDITYNCNLKCTGCNRSCAQKPTNEQLQLSDIDSFISESIANKKKWKQINVLGGEPTLHKDFMEMLKRLQDYADVYSQETVIQVVSNGVAERSRLLCELAKEKFKNVRIDYGSYKLSNKVEYFSAFNDAPVDDGNYKNADFTKACWATNYCGIGLTPRGYYACAVSGGIDRVLNEKNGVQSFTELTKDKLKEHFDKFCRLCGNFKAYSQNYGNFIPRCEKEPFKNIISETWKEIYGNPT